MEICNNVSNTHHLLPVSSVCFTGQQFTAISLNISNFCSHFHTPVPLTLLRHSSPPPCPPCGLSHHLCHPSINTVDEERAPFNSVTRLIYNLKCTPCIYSWVWQFMETLLLQINAITFNCMKTLIKY